MSKIAFYAASTGLEVGATGILIAIDVHDSGPDGDPATDDGCQLYSFVSLTTLIQIAKIKTKMPIPIPAKDFPGGLFVPGRDLVTRFSVKPGGTTMGSVADFSLEIFENSSRVYGVAPEGQNLKADMADRSFGTAEISFQDRVEPVAMFDPLEGWAKLINISDAGEVLWRDLMRPDPQLAWF